MNIKFLLVLFLALPMFASCDKAAEAAGDFDLTSLTAEGAPAKATEMLSSLTSGLGEINAENAAAKVKELLPAVTNLSALKEKFASALPDMAGLKTAIEGLKTKFTGNEAVMTALKPLMDKLTGLVG